MTDFTRLTRHDEDGPAPAQRRWRGLALVVGLALILGCGEAGSVNDRPELTLNHAALDLGRVAVGESMVGYLVASNTGNAPLTIRAPQILGAHASAFTLPADLTGGTLTPGGEFTHAITFAPDAVGVADATLELPHDALNTQSPVMVPLSGEGI